MSEETQSETPAFDANKALDTVRQERGERRHRRTWGKSKLVRHRAELVKLRQAGASLSEIVHWLKTAHRMKADKSTVSRYLATLPEMQAESPRPGVQDA